MNKFHPFYPPIYRWSIPWISTKLERSSIWSRAERPLASSGVGAGVGARTKLRATEDMEVEEVEEVEEEEVDLDNDPNWPKVKKDPMSFWLKLMLDACKLIFDGHNLNVLGLLNFEFVSLREEMIRIWNIRHEAQRHSGTAVVGNLPQWKACQGYRYKGFVENRAISRSSTSNQFNGWSGSFFLVSVCLGCCRPSHFIWIFWCSLCFCATNINLTSFSWLLTSYYPTFLKVFSFRPKTWQSESDEWLVADDVKAWSFSLQLLGSHWMLILCGKIACWRSSSWTSTCKVSWEGALVA